MTKQPSLSERISETLSTAKVALSSAFLKAFNYHTANENLSTSDPNGALTLAYMLENYPSLEFSLNVAISGNPVRVLQFKGGAYSEQNFSKRDGTHGWTTGKILKRTDGHTKLELFGLNDSQSRDNDLESGSTATMEFNLSSPDGGVVFKTVVPFVVKSHGKLKLALMGDALRKSYQELGLPVNHCSLVFKKNQRGRMYLDQMRVSVHYRPISSALTASDSPGNTQSTPGASGSLPSDENYGLEILSLADGANQQRHVGCKDTDEIHVGTLARTILAHAIKKMAKKHFKNQKWGDIKHRGALVVDLLRGYDENLATVFQKLYSGSEPASLQQLLTNTSGLPATFHVDASRVNEFVDSLLPEYYHKFPSEDSVRSQFITHLEDTQLASAPGTLVIPSEIGWVLLGMIAKALSGGESVKEIVLKHLKKLGCPDARYHRDITHHTRLDSQAASVGLIMSRSSLLKLLQHLGSGHTFKPRFADTTRPEMISGVADWVSPNPEHYQSDVWVLYVPQLLNEPHVALVVAPGTKTAAVYQQNLSSFSSQYEKYASGLEKFVGQLVGESGDKPRSVTPVGFPPRFSDSSNGNSARKGFDADPETEKSLNGLATRKVQLIALFPGRDPPALTVTKTRVPGAFNLRLHQMMHKPEKQFKKVESFVRVNIAPADETGQYMCTDKGTGMFVSVAKLGDQEGEDEYCISVGRSIYLTKKALFNIHKRYEDQVKSLETTLDSHTYRSKTHAGDKNRLDTFKAILAEFKIPDDVMNHSAQLLREHLDTAGDGEEARIGSIICGPFYHLNLFGQCVPDIGYGGGYFGYGRPLYGPYWGGGWLGGGYRGYRGGYGGGFGRGGFGHGGRMGGHR